MEINGSFSSFRFLTFHSLNFIQWFFFARLVTFLFSLTHSHLFLLFFKGRKFEKNSKTQTFVSQKVLKLNFKKVQKSTHDGCLCFYKTIQYLDVRKIEYKVFYKQIDLYMTLHGGLKLAPSYNETQPISYNTYLYRHTWQTTCEISSLSGPYTVHVLPIVS